MKRVHLLHLSIFCRLLNSYYLLVLACCNGVPGSSPGNPQVGPTLWSATSFPHAGGKVKFWVN